jgi:IclR helix-turn-helix domain
MLVHSMLDDSDSRDVTAEGGKQRTRRVEAGVGASGGEPPRQWLRTGRPVQRPGRNRDGENDAGKVMIELSKSQVDQVVRGAGEGGTMSILLSALRDPDWTLAVDSEDWSYPEQMEDRRLSRSLLSGLLVLSCFPPDGGYLGIAELARMLDMNTSTTHRYVTTLLAVGLIERDPATRRYRIAAA